MLSQPLIDLLLRHADSLAAGQDLTVMFLREHPELSAWVELVRSVAAALTPVTPAAEFTAALRRDLLLAFEFAHPVIRTSDLWLGAAIGSAVSLAGVAVMRTRRWKQLLRRPRSLTTSA